MHKSLTKRNKLQNITKSQVSSNLCCKVGEVRVTILFALENIPIPLTTQNTEEV